MIEFASDEWAKALMSEINKSEAYAEAARTWEGDFFLILEAGGPIQEPVYVYLDVWHGKCRAAYATKDPSVGDPEFRMSGSLKNWRRVIEKKLDPLQGLLTRQFTLKGNMVKVMRAVRASQELVNCTTRVPTLFPE